MLHGMTFQTRPEKMERGVSVVCVGGGSSVREQVRANNSIAVFTVGLNYC